MCKYDEKQIAIELRATALSFAYFGNALYVAMSIPGLSDDDKAVLQRYLHHSQKDDDCLYLQEIARKIEVMGKPKATPVSNATDDCVANLQKFFDELTDEEFERIWAEVESYHFTGPSAAEYLKAIGYPLEEE